MGARFTRTGPDGEGCAGRSCFTGPGVSGGLDGYRRSCRSAGKVIQFLSHRGYPVPSPACLQQIGDAFRRRAGSFGEANHIPGSGPEGRRPQHRGDEPLPGPGGGHRLLAGRGDRGPSGAAAGVHRPSARHRPGKSPQFSFDKKDRRVTVYYFYLWDAGFGPAFSDLHLLPMADENLGQRPRVGQTAGPQDRARLHRTVQRVRQATTRPCCRRSTTH